MINEWYYRKQTGDAGLNKNPARIKDLGEHSIRIFIREVLQNNLDAAQEGKPVNVSIRLHEWKKNEVESFFQFVGKGHIDLLKQSAIEAHPSVAPYLKECVEIINGKKSTFYTVIVEETNCIGLTGPVRETKQEKSHFDALMRKIENNEAKKETSNTGGTHGKGSSIFTYTSLLWTWFSYTNLSKPWYDPVANIYHRKRFIGRCMLAPFFDSEKNESLLGDGWFCDLEKLTSERIDAYPFINEKADAFASKLGIPLRNNDQGTTFFIPFFRPEIENGSEEITLEILQKKFVEQVLQNWFIPIYNDQLTVCISSDSESTKIDKSYLSSVKELKFKLQLLDWYEKGCPPGDKKFLREPIEIEVPALKKVLLDERTGFAKERQKAKADLIIRVLDEDENFKDNWQTINKVALCRNKGMIINDESVFEHKSLRTESILLGGLMTKAYLPPDEKVLEKRKHFDLFLAYSENPAHNTWCRTPNDYERCFLDRFEGKRPKPEASINHLFNEISRIFKKLVEDESEEKGKQDICSVFKKLARLKSRGDEHGAKALFHMRTIQDDIDSEGGYLFTRRIISAIETSNIEVFFKSCIDSLEGDKDKDFEYLGIREFADLQILDSNNEIICEGINPKISLSPNEEIIVKIRTCKIDKNPLFKNVEPFIKCYAKELTND
jgi:hypothetical protein